MTKSKLQEKLCEQLQRSDLKPVVDNFVGKLVRYNPDLKNDAESIAEYLTVGQGDRHLHVAQFLTAVESFGPSKPKQSAIQDLLGYLLQTLVRRYCEESDQGLTHIQVEKLQTVKLVGASRTSVPYLPNYINSKDHAEHENGQKNDRFQNIGQHFPIEGGLDEAAKCNEIANALLPLFGYSSDAEVSNPLELLIDNLSAYIDAPENSPLQALYLEKESKHNPLHIDSIAAKFLQDLDQLLWVYVYGGGINNAQDWLYTSETKIEGLVNRYERQSKSETPQETKEEDQMKPGQVISGNNNTVNNNYGIQENTQIGQGNIKINQTDIKQLQDHLDEVIKTAHDANDINESQCADINQVIKDIKQEIQKQKVDGSILVKAKTDLESFKEILSISGGVASIIQLLAMILG